MMGKYNLGSVAVKTGADGVLSLEKVNHHAHFQPLRKVVQLSSADRKQVRECFYQSVEDYLQSKGLGTRGKEFLAAIHKDLCEGENVDRDLSRNDDIARILDMLDFAVETDDFTVPNGEKPLSDRFVTRYRQDLDKLDASAKEDERQARFTDAVKHATAAIDSLKDGASAQQVDFKLVSLAAKWAGCSEKRVTTYLTTRSETILNRAAHYVLKAPDTLSSEVLGKLSKTGLARLATIQALRELHLETMRDVQLSQLGDQARQTANILLGNAAVPVAAMKDEFRTLLPQLAQLTDGEASEMTVKFNGTTVKLLRGERRVTATVEKVKLDLPDVKQLLTSLMNAIDCASGEAGMSLEVLRELHNDDKFFVEGRRLPVCKWVLKCAAAVAEVELQGLATDDFLRIADKVLRGEYDGQNLATDVRKDIAKAGENRIYSPAMLKTVQKFRGEDASQVTLGREFLDKLPRPAAINRLAADLFCNENVWMLDEHAQSVPGERIRQTLLQDEGHRQIVAKFLQGMVNDDTNLDQLAFFQGVNLAEPLQQTLEVLKAAGVNDLNSLETFLNDPESARRFAAVEQSLNESVETSIAALEKEFQQLVGDGFKANDNNGEVWQKTLDEIVRDQQQSCGSVEGRFLLKVMKEYLGKASYVDKRMMLASCLRLAKADARIDVKFGALLKGAGPVFHKLMQGIPESRIPENLRGVFEDMKSNLAPIPTEVVNAMLRELVDSSDSRIKHIEVVDVLGSASVGQAFLCKVTDSSGDVRECVVKMLKPDVQNRLARELPRLREFAREVDGGENGAMSRTFEGRLDTIREELNFKAEAQYIKEGDIYNGRESEVASVRLAPGVDSRMNILLMEKASGMPLDKYLGRELDEKMNAVKAKTVEFRTISGSSLRQARTLAEVVALRDELDAVLVDLRKRQDMLYTLAKQWFREGAFGTGFFHADLHAGNIMVDDDKATIIDYGNAMKLGKDDLAALKKLVCAAAAQSPEDFLDTLNGRLSDDGKAIMRTNRSALLAELDDFFGKGDLNDTGARLYAALNVIQRYGIEVPKAIYNFAQSQSRIQNAMDELGAKISEVTSLHDKLTAPFPFGALERGGKLVRLYALETMLLLFSDFGSNTAVKFYHSGAERRLKEDWEGAVNEVLDMEDFAEQIDNDFLPYLHGFDFMSGEDGQNMKNRIDEAGRRWLESDRTREDARELLDFSRALQLEVLRRFDELGMPKVKRYGDAVQEVLLGYVSNDQGEIDKGKGIQFAWSVGVGLAKKVGEAWNAQIDREDGKSKLMLCMNKNHDGSVYSVSCGNFDCDSENCTSNVDEKKQYFNSGRRMAFSGRTLAFIGKNEWWKSADNCRQFMTEWLYNLINLYRGAVKTHKLLGVRLRETNLQYMPIADRQRYLEIQPEGIQFIENEDFNEKIAEGYAGEGFQTMQYEQSHKLPIAYFANAVQPNVFDQFGNMDESTLSAFKQLGKEMLAQFKPTEDEFDELAEELYLQQPPPDSNMGAKFNRNFYKDAIRQDFEKDLDNYIDESLDFIYGDLEVLADEKRRR